LRVARLRGLGLGLGVGVGLLGVARLRGLGLLGIGRRLLLLLLLLGVLGLRGLAVPRRGIGGVLGLHRLRWGGVGRRRRLRGVRLATEGRRVTGRYPPPSHPRRGPGRFQHAFRKRMGK